MAENGRFSGALTPRKRRAIAELLTARNAQEAAVAARVGYRTILRWLENPEFRAALIQAEGNVLDSATRRLLAGQAKALATLEALIENSRSDYVKRQAAIDWL